MNGASPCSDVVVCTMPLQSVERSSTAAEEQRAGRAGRRAAGRRERARERAKGGSRDTQPKPSGWVEGPLPRLQVLDEATAELMKIKHSPNTVTRAFKVLPAAAAHLHAPHMQCVFCVAHRQ